VRIKIQVPGTDDAVAAPRVSVAIVSLVTMRRSDWNLQDCIAGIYRKTIDTKSMPSSRIRQREDLCRLVHSSNKAALLRRREAVLTIGYALPLLANHSKCGSFRAFGSIQCRTASESDIHGSQRSRRR
jgi:hypothetical protein